MTQKALFCVLFLSLKEVKLSTKKEQRMDWKRQHQEVKQRGETQRRTEIFSCLVVRKYYHLNNKQTFAYNKHKQTFGVMI